MREMVPNLCGPDKINVNNSSPEILIHVGNVQGDCMKTYSKF